VNTPEQRRLAPVYLDNLAAAAIVLIVVHHAGLPYGMGGRWYFQSPTWQYRLWPFFAANAAFALPLLFLVSGYLLPIAHRLWGSGRFVGRCLLRLGVPLVVYALALVPLMSYARYAQLRQGVVPTYWAYLSGPYLRGSPPDATPPDLELGPLSFAAELLVYALVYAAWRWAAGRRVRVKLRPAPVPSETALLALALGLAAVSFALRIWFPIGSPVAALRTVPVDVAHLPQHLAMFVFGVVACRRDWLGRLRTSVGITWLCMGVAMLLPAYALGLSGDTTDLSPFMGGLRVEALVYAVWESILCVGLCVGLATLFRIRFYRAGPIGSILCPNGYALYLLHLPIVVGAQHFVAGARLPTFPKFTLSVLTALAFGLWLSEHMLRRLPGVRAVFADAPVPLAEGWEE
jgi:fucose 4-O-acetylase-like acetyltransferase